MSCPVRASVCIAKLSFGHRNGQRVRAADDDPAGVGGVQEDAGDAPPVRLVAGDGGRRQWRVAGEEGPAGSPGDAARNGSRWRR
jgi:hypothetical protein